MGAVSRAIARQPVPGRDHLLRVIASEYREMPGMRLTPSQFGRLWNLGATECVEVVRELIRAATCRKTTTAASAAAAT